MSSVSLNLSKIITFLRLPLIVGVVAVHANLCALIAVWTGIAPEFPLWLDTIFNHMSDILFPDIVALLFVISGYLFFRNCDNADCSFFVDKLKRRVHTLLIPYIAWNTLAMLLFFVKSGAWLGRLAVKESGVMGFWECLAGYWELPSNVPYNGPLWYVRNLMVVCLLSPILYFMLRHRWGMITLLVFALSVAFGLNTGIPGLDIYSIFYFSLGAWLSLRKTDVIKIPSAVGAILVSAYFPLSFFQLDISDSAWYVFGGIIAFSLKSVALFYFAALMLSRGIFTANPKMAGKAFFLYALHGLIIGPVIKTLYLASGCSDNPLILLFIYVFSIVSVIAISMLGYSLLKKHSSPLLKIFSGNRA